MDLLNQENGGLTNESVALFQSNNSEFRDRGRLDVKFEDAENEHRKQYYVGVTRARRGVYIICSSLPDMLRSFPISSYKTNKNTGNTSTGFF